MTTQNLMRMYLILYNTKFINNQICGTDCHMRHNKIYYQSFRKQIYFKINYEQDLMYKIFQTFTKCLVTSKMGTITYIIDVSINKIIHQRQFC